MAKKKPELRSRPPLQRMLRLHQLLQDREYPNCSRMAREFEVAVRTIIRDLDFMRDQLKLPIEFDAQRNGFFYSKPVEEFPWVPVTEAEVFALLVAHKAIAQYHGTPFQQPLEAAFRKLTGQLDHNAHFSLGHLGDTVSFRPLAPDETDLRGFQRITQALQQRRALKFLYRNLGAQTSQQRLVHPYHLACIENHWYLFAFDVKRQAMRNFVLTRMRNPELTSERFTLPKSFDPTEYLRGSFSAFKGDYDYEVVVDFDAWATDLLRGRKWHPSQELTELPKGCSRLRLRLNSIEEMERWVLSWGAHARVVRPRALLERIYQATEAVSAHCRQLLAGDLPVSAPERPRARASRRSLFGI